jgi:HK97 family phage portal protein
MVGHLLAWGNFYGQPIWDQTGQVTEIWPLRPDRMAVARVDGNKIYVYTPTTGGPRIFLADEILHVPAFGFDGLIGYSRIHMARNAIGLSISAEKFGAKFFANGAHAGVVITVPGSLSDTAYEHLTESWNEQHRGVENAHKAAILEEGASIEKIGIPLDDAQFLETRKFQVSEIARIFRVPPHMIGDVEKSTSWGTGIDSQEQGYVNHTLRPWATRIEEALRLQILPEEMREAYYYEHLMDAFLRGDIQTRYEAYVKAITNGMMSHNEVRGKENMNPYSGGDGYWMQAQMVRIGSPDTGNAAASLEPLWHDAIGRIVKRETNDVAGAVRRLALKGQAKRFEAWLLDFYGKDHPAFIRKQLQPILETERRLLGLDRWDEIEAALQAALSARHAQLLEMAPEELLEGLEAYGERAAGDLFELVRPELPEAAEPALQEDPT